MLLEPVDPNEKFRERRRQNRKRRSLRRILALAVVALAAAASALGMTFLNGWGGQTAPLAGSQPPGPGTSTAAETPQPAALPEEIRGVHVTAALASLEGKLDEYLALTDSGLTALELDVKDENGEVGFQRLAPPLARAVGAAQPFYNPREAARAAEAAGVYLIGRVVVFEDPVLAANRPQLAIGRRGGGVWTNSAGLAWTNPYNKRVWKYNVDIAVAAAKAGFDEIMFDYVRFPTDGDISAAVFPGTRERSKNATIAELPRVRALAARAARDARLRRRLRAHGDPRHGHRPAAPPARTASRRDLPDGLPLPLRVGRVLHRRPERRSRGHGGAGAPRLPRDLRGRETVIVPWLQDFSLGRDYTLEDVSAQILAARDAKAGGFLLWNPNGVYQTKALAGS